MPVTTIDDKTALIVVDLQKGIVNLPAIHPISGVVERSFNAARMIGPALAGLLIAKVGTGWAFLINGISFAAVLISMSLFRISELQLRVRATRAPGGFMEGFRYVWGRAELRTITIMLFLIGTFGLNFPIFTSRWP